MNESDFEESLKWWWKEIKSDSRLQAMPSAPIFDLVESASFEIAQVVPRSTPSIEVAATFSKDIESELDARLEEATCAILSGLEFEDSVDEAMAFVESGLRENVVSFVVLHELFHILAGHLREQEKYLDSRRPLSEMSLGMADSNDITEFDESELLRSYYREFEVDDCALQALVQEKSLDFLSSIETEEQDGLLAYDLTNSYGLPKVFGFRLIAVSAWLMVRLIESKRAPQIREQFELHPLPSARLLSCFTTLLEEYTQLSGEEMDAGGRRSRKPTEGESESIVEFFELVFKPLAVHLSPIELSSNATALADFAYDMNGLMFDKEMKTAAGELVLRLQSLRPEMESRLSSCRYYHSF